MAFYRVVVVEVLEMTVLLEHRHLEMEGMAILTFFVTLNSRHNYISLLNKLEVHVPSSSSAPGIIEFLESPFGDIFRHLGIID